MDDYTGVVVGVAGATIANVAWEAWPGSEIFHYRAVQAKSPLAYIEHYHIGLLLTLADRLIDLKGVGYGAGAVMVTSELFQENPFGIGKSEEEVRGNLILGSILGGLLIIAFNMK